VAVSYLVTSWFDVSAGFYAMATNRPEGGSGGPFNETRSLHLLTYGPVLSIGFRF